MAEASSGSTARRRGLAQRRALYERRWRGREGAHKRIAAGFDFFELRRAGTLARRLEAKLPFVWVDPAGIKAVLPQRVKAACEEVWGLVISPVATGTGLNKHRAIWCNRWVLKVAERIYVGTIKKGGTLDTLLKGRHGGRPFTR